VGKKVELAKIQFSVNTYFYAVMMITVRGRMVCLICLIICRRPGVINGHFSPDDSAAAWKGAWHSSQADAGPTPLLYTGSLAFSNIN